MPAGLGGMGGAKGAAALPGGRGGAGIPAFGGAGIVGGAPATVGRGLGGRLIMAASRGLEAPGFPSRRGGRTMRTVSFLGSFMVGFATAGGMAEASGRSEKAELTAIVKVSNVSLQAGDFFRAVDLELAWRIQLRQYRGLFSKAYGKDSMDRARKAQT